MSLDAKDSKPTITDLIEKYESLKVERKATQEAIAAELTRIRDSREYLLHDCDSMLSYFRKLNVPFSLSQYKHLRLSAERASGRKREA